MLAPITPYSLYRRLEYSGSTEPPITLDESHLSRKIEPSIPTLRANKVYYYI
jgi:hypothetical protein